MPKVMVTLTEEKTGASRTVTANDDGFYNATSLAAGVYSVSAGPTGFKKSVTTGVELHVNENKTVNLELQVGQVTETVTVTSEQTAVELRSGEVSSLVSEKQVTELPLNGRNYALERVDRLAEVQVLAHRGVDLCGRHRTVGECGAGHDRLRARLGRVVTLEAHAHEVVAETEREHDLRRGGQQGDDAHACIVRSPA
jgi:hypothetical protein